MIGNSMVYLLRWDDYKIIKNLKEKVGIILNFIWYLF